MPVEVAKLVDDFNKLWPRGTDPVSKADDHIRMIKEVLKLEFELLYNKTRVFSFEAGAVVNPDCILYYEAEKAFYQWNGTYDVNNEYVVNAGSTPETAGGIGGNAWTRSTGSGFMSTVLVSDTEPTAPFQNMLWWDTNSGTFFIYYNDGTSTQWVDLFGIADQASFNPLLFRSILARLAAESGYTLVGGSFQEGAVSSGFSDVVLDWNTAKFYQWHLNENKEVPAGSTPATSGGIGAGAWVDRTDLTLRGELNSTVFNSVKYLSSYVAIYNNQTEALQAALDDLFPKYGSYYNVNALGSGKKLIIDGDYSVSEIDLSYRNYVNIEQTGTLTYSGSVVDGVWIEAKGSSYTKWKGCKLNGADKVGSFIHQSGDGYSSGDSGSHDALTGKGNVTGIDYYRLEMTGQYPGSTKTQFDTIPYTSDTTNSYYYSVDDSIFYKPVWKTYSLDGFCLSIGSSTITLIKPILANMNGIKLHPSASYTAIGPVWSLRGGSYGANYAVTNADIGQIDLFGPYLEETNNLFKHAGGTILARLRHLNVYGGIYAGKSTATRVIDIPSGVEGSIRIDGMRVQETYGRKIYAPSCSLSLKDYSNSNTTTNQRSYGFQIESVGMLSSEIMSDLGIFSGGYNPNVNANLYVNGNSNSYLGEFPDLDSAINYAVASKAQKVTINVYQDVTINQQHNFSGNIEIKGVTSQRGLVINVMPYVIAGSSLTIGELITVNNPTSGITRLIRNNGGTFEFKGRINFNNGTALVEHYKGESMFNNATQFYGQFIDASYAYATGRIMFKSMTWATHAIAVLGGMASCEIHSSSLPASTVNIPAGTKWLTTVAANADCVYQMVTVGGPNPTWKKFGAIV